MNGNDNAIRFRWTDINREVSVEFKAHDEQSLSEAALDAAIQYRLWSRKPTDPRYPSAQLEIQIPGLKTWYWPKPDYSKDVMRLPTRPLATDTEDCAPSDEKIIRQCAAVWWEQASRDAADLSAALAVVKSH